MPLTLDPITEAEYERLSQGSAGFRHLAIRNFVHWRLYLNPDQTYLYRCYIWLLHEHTDLQQRHMLMPDQDKELGSIAKLVHLALARLSRPDMVNELYAGNEYQQHRGHAHLHLIPRYSTPPFFGSRTFPDLRFGRNYAPYERVSLLPDDIQQIRQSLQGAIEETIAELVGR